MKKYLGLFLAAMIGGFVSVGTYKFLEEQPKVIVQTNLEEPNDLQSSANNQLVGLPSMAGTPVDFTNAAEGTINAVVHVKTSFQRQTSGDPLMEYFFGYPGQGQKQAQGSGSGVILSADGFIVTNNHVIDKANEVLVTLNNNEEYTAEVIGTDPNTDLALLKIDANDLPFVPYGNSDGVKVGEWVLAVGNPFNLTSTVTAGIVSAKGRDINILRNKSQGGISAVESFIQTDAAVNPGNSGGALVNAQGELVGINTAIKSNTGSYAGYAFSVPVNIVRKVVNDLMEFGTVQRAFIGVSIRNVNAQLAEAEDLDVLSGVYIAGVTSDGAAKEAGIESGDVIRKIGNVEVKDVPELQEQLSKFRPGNSVIVTVQREEKELEFPLVLKNQYGNTDLMDRDISEVSSALGAEFSNLEEEEKSKLKIETGLKVNRLQRGKLMSSGIREGFIITKVDKKPVNNVNELNEALKGKKGGVLIEGVYPNGVQAYYGFGM
ncbi:MAG: trypsin-like peptidase domain-containing protein [Salibacteraceae bacterium]